MTYLFYLTRIQTMLTTKYLQIHPEKMIKLDFQKLSNFFFSLLPSPHLSHCSFRYLRLNTSLSLQLCMAIFSDNKSKQTYTNFPPYNNLTQF